AGGGVSELFERHPANPILTARDWPYPVNAVFNPAAAAVNGEVVLLARVDELDRWVITCTAHGPAGPGVFLATTEDFRTVERYGVVRHPEDKNAALLPHRIDGRWVLLHRPKTQFGGGHGEILLSRSDDLLSWSAPEQVLQPRAGAWWDSLRIGIGPPPLRTEHGWLLLYHGVKDTVAGELYRVGLALLDLDEPTRVLRRLPTWILAPLADYER